MTKKYFITIINCCSVDCIHFFSLNKYDICELEKKLINRDETGLYKDNIIKPENRRFPKWCPLSNYGKIPLFNSELF